MYGYDVGIINHGCLNRGGESGGGSFDRQSDEIYSEVASLISQNEHCPDFLVQLFRKLQCLSTDFLRQRALYALQDLVSRATPAEPELVSCC